MLKKCKSTLLNTKEEEFPSLRILNLFIKSFVNPFFDSLFTLILFEIIFFSLSPKSFY